MKIRFGYVATALNLENCSPSRTVTVANINKLPDMETKINKLRRLGKENLNNTLRILRYNTAHDIYVYRVTSKLIPLATFQDFDEWDYAADLSDAFEELGGYIKKNNFRVSAHPDHFTLLNSPNQKVTEASLKDLQYHDTVFNAMGLTDNTLVMHIGGLYKDKNSSLQRFRDNFTELPASIKKRLALENDDKSYSTKDVYEICAELCLPMVLDVHHHNCCNHGENLGEYLPKIFDTWKHQIPKVHMSSPKNSKQFRHHADYIDTNEFLDFLSLARELDTDFDVMIEAKNKDLALFKLMDDLKNVAGIKLINQAAIEVLAKDWLT